MGRAGRSQAPRAASDDEHRARRRAGRRRGDGPRHVRAVALPAQRPRPGPGDRAGHRPALPARGRGAGRAGGHGAVPRRRDAVPGRAAHRHDRGRRRGGAPRARRAPGAPAARRRPAAGRRAPGGLAARRDRPGRRAARRRGDRARTRSTTACGWADASPPSRSRSPSASASPTSWTGCARARTPSAPDGADAAPPLSSVGVAAGVVGCLAGVAYGEHALTDLARPPAGRGAARAARALAAGRPRGLPRRAGGRRLRGLAPGDAADRGDDVGRRARDRAGRGPSGGCPPTVSGGPGSLVSWAGMGRDGRLHALASVRPQPLAEPPGRRAGPVDRDRHGHARARRPRAGVRRAGQRADAARAGRPGDGRAGADRRAGPVAARPRLPHRHRLRQLRRRRRAAVPRARRRRHRDPAVLAPPVAAVARHGARGPGAEPAAVAADPPAPPRPARPPPAGRAVRREPRRAHQPGRLPALGNARPRRDGHRPGAVDRDAVRQQVDAPGHPRRPPRRRPGGRRRRQRPRPARRPRRASAAARRASCC